MLIHFFKPFTISLKKSILTLLVKKQFQSFEKIVSVVIVFSQVSSPWQAILTNKFFVSSETSSCPKFKEKRFCSQNWAIIQLFSLRNKILVSRLARNASVLKMVRSTLWPVWGFQTSPFQYLQRYLFMQVFTRNSDVIKHK